MHTYKSIYMYAYMLCTKRFVIIFVVIVWKTTLNTLKSLKEIICEDYSKKIIWERRFERDHLRRIIWEESFEEDSERKYLIRETEQNFEKAEISNVSK
jgi:hypothetical protein